MDRHDLKSVTAKDVAEAHREDLKIQDNYQCKGLTYWFDEERGTAFCLVEAPNEYCVKEMHDNAHGLVPHQIIEVDKNVVNAFLGRIEDPKSSRLLDNSNLPIIDEPAFRIIMCICIAELSILQVNYGNEQVLGLTNTFEKIIRETVAMNDGSEVKHSGNRYLISFTSVSNALTCARDIRKHIKSMHHEIPRRIIQIKTGLSAGSPVSGKRELFGEAVQLAQRLCEVANQDRVVVSSMVNDLFASEGINQLKNEVNVQAFRPADEEFMNSLVDITESGWNEPGLDVEKYCREIGLSRSQLYRKTTALTGLSPNDFIREYRLKKALGLIESKKGNISEIAFEAGFNSPSYFSKCFKRRFGVLPTDLAGTLT